jgi:hypothetical protein
MPFPGMGYFKRIANALWGLEGTDDGAFFSIPCAECQSPVRSIFRAEAAPGTPRGAVAQLAFCPESTGKGCGEKFWNKRAQRRADGHDTAVHVSDLPR